MAIGRITMYEWSEKWKKWEIHKDHVSLRVADTDIKHSKKRLVAVHNGIVIAASEVDDLDLVFDDIIHISMAS